MLLLKSKFPIYNFLNEILYQKYYIAFFIFLEFWEELLNYFEKSIIRNFFS